MSSLKQQYIDHLTKKYKGLNASTLDPLVSENLLSPYKVKLSKKAFLQGKDFIEACFKVRSHASYLKQLEEKARQKGLIDPGNKGIMMSYDFHVDENGDLKLIEINTNAAFLVLGFHMYEIHEAPLPVPNFNINHLQKCIEQELSLFGSEVKKPTLTITDEQPEQQRLYAEFLVAQELFKSWGWNCTIRDIAEALKDQPDFIYNRYTDFYLEQEKSKHLRNAFLEKKVCFSPNPFEYFALADKERLTEWSQGSLDKISDLKNESAIIQRNLLKSFPLNESTKEELWQSRKKLFFKPTQEHGSKGSFRGSTVSRKAFEELLSKQAIGQEYVPAPELTFESGAGPISFKYDLRFYAYQGELQLVLARLYQGQTTNLRTPGGGFTCVELV